MKTFTSVLTLAILWRIPFGSQVLCTEDPLRPSDHWVATDALERMLLEHREVGDRRGFVGVFYFVWVGNHAQQVRDISGTLKEEDESKRQWGPERATQFGCEPEYALIYKADGKIGPGANEKIPDTKSSLKRVMQRAAGIQTNDSRLSQ